MELWHRAHYGSVIDDYIADLRQLAPERYSDEHPAIQMPPLELEHVKPQHLETLKAVRKLLGWRLSNLFCLEANLNEFHLQPSVSPKFQPLVHIDKVEDKLQYVSLLDHTLNVAHFAMQQFQTVPEMGFAVKYAIWHDVGKSEKLKKRYAIPKETPHEIAGARFMDYCVLTNCYKYERPQYEEVVDFLENHKQKEYVPSRFGEALMQADRLAREFELAEAEKKETA